MIIGVLIFACKLSFKKDKFEKHELLVTFKVQRKSPENLYGIPSFKEEDYWDRPRKLKTVQKGDTLQINFEVFEGGSTKIDGNIEIKGDTLELKIGKGIGVTELVIHDYEYQILNSKKIKYEIEIRNNLDFENL